MYVGKLWNPHVMMETMHEADYCCDDKGCMLCAQVFSLFRGKLATKQECMEDEFVEEYETREEID